MNSAHKVAYIGFLVSLSVILTRIFSFYALPTIRIGFGNVPIIFSGILLGPISGAITGGLSDVVGMLVFPSGGAYFPGFTISKILLGAIPGIIMNHYKGSKISGMVLSIILSEIICSLILDTLWLSMFYNKGILAMLPSRIIARVIITAAEIPMVLVTYGALNHALHLDKL